MKSRRKEKEREEKEREEKIQTHLLGERPEEER